MSLTKNFLRNQKLARLAAKRLAQEQRNKDLKAGLPMPEELWKQVDEKYVRAKMKRQAEIGGEK